MMAALMVMERKVTKMTQISKLICQSCAAALAKKVLS
jgi:hypothetical protein